jgi:large subunit ribosomal protein L7/L12
MDTSDDTGPGGSAGRPVAWEYLELSYDTADRARVSLDGAQLSDGRPAAEVIGDLGTAGWEMVSSAGGQGTSQVLWFRRPVRAVGAVGAVAAPPWVVAGTSEPLPSTCAVVLVKIGDARYDPDRHARLVAAISAITGQSGWRATRIVDKAPRVVASDVSPEEALRIKAALDELGATVQIR